MRASIASRIARVCSGVVPQQPPTMVAPAATMRGTISPKYSGPAEYTKRPSIRCGNPALGMIDRATVAEGRPVRTSASRHTSGPAPQLTPTASTPAEARAAAAASGVAPSRARKSSPKVIWATIGMAQARLTSSMASSKVSRSPKVSRTNMSAPPSSSPSICSRKAARAMPGWGRGRPGIPVPSGPIETATRASRPAVSRASRASWAPRLLICAASFSSP